MPVVTVTGTAPGERCADLHGVALIPRIAASSANEALSKYVVQYQASPQAAHGAEPVTLGLPLRFAGLERSRARTGSQRGSPGESSAAFHAGTSSRSTMKDAASKAATHEPTRNRIRLSDGSRLSADAMYASYVALLGGSPSARHTRATAATQSLVLVLE